jgi:thiamine transporter ThiT
MTTIYDWVCLGIFAGLVVLFLQRSTGPQDHQDDSLIHYLVAGAACGVANYFGNEGQNAIAILLLVGTLAFVAYYLKPFQSGSTP